MREVYIEKARERRKTCKERERDRERQRERERGREIKNDRQQVFECVEKDNDFVKF